MVHTPVEEKGNTEKEVSSQLSHWKTSLKTSELDKTEDQGTPSADVPEQFSDINSRYNFIGLCAVKEKAYKVIFAIMLRFQDIIYNIVLASLS